MIERKCYYPTPIEIDAIDRAGVAAAFAELQKMDGDPESIKSWALICIDAFKSAETAVQQGQKALHAQHPECDFVSHYVDTGHIVCSALYGACLSLDEPGDIAPESLGGLKILALVKAYVAMEAMAHVSAAFDDDDSLPTYIVDEVAAIARALQE